MQYYTNVYQRGNALYVRGVDSGRRYNEKVDFRPTLWVKGKVKDASDKWQTLDGQTVFAIQPGSIYDCKAYIDQYKDVHGFEIYESPGHAYQYIAETFTGDIRFDPADIAVFTVDIETETEYGFPDPSLANEVVQLITVKDTRHNKITTFGLKPYNNQRDDVWYRQFSSEQSLLKEFIIWWQMNYPDVVTGWNSRFFDLPYLYNRISKVLGEDWASKLSPWGQCRLVDVQQFGGHDKIRRKLTIAGIADLDYLELYRKFTYSAQESYRLDYIASVELGERKLENPTGTGQFKAFYSGEFEVPNKPSDDAHEIEKKGYLRTQMKKELERRGLLQEKK